MFGDVRSVIQARRGFLPKHWFKDEVVCQYVLGNIKKMEWRVKASVDWDPSYIWIYAGDLQLHQVRMAGYALQAAVALVIEKANNMVQPNEAILNAIEARKKYALGEMDVVEFRDVLRKALRVAMQASDNGECHEVIQAYWAAVHMNTRLANCYATRIMANTGCGMDVIADSFKSHLLNGEPLIWKERF